MESIWRPVFILLLTWNLLTVSLTANTQTRQELNQIDSALQAERKTLKQRNRQREKALLEIESIEKQIAERNLRYEQTRNKAESLKKKISLIEQERKKIEQDYDLSREKLARLVESVYLMGPQSALKVTLSQNGVQNIARLNHYMRSISSARQNQLDALQSLQQQLQINNDKLNNEQKQLNKLTSALQEDQRYLGRLRQSRLAAINQLDKTISTSSQEIEHLKTRRARLEKVLADVARRRQKEARARASARRYQPKKQPPAPLRNPVTVGKGQLPLPANARIVSRFGDKRQKSGLPWTGIFMEGQEGSKIRAIADGEVVYADWLPGYGQMIIIDHGNGLMSLYGHNKRIFRSVGEKVKQSDIIATMGTTAGLRKPALYFEIRKNGEAQDPLVWAKG